MADIDIVTWAQAKAFLGEADANQTTIEAIITRASRWWEHQTGREWMSATHTLELYDGDGSDTLELRHEPLTAGQVTVVKFLQSRVPTVWETQALTYLELDTRLGREGSIYFNDRRFPRGQRNVQVTYVGGYSLDGAVYPVILEDVQYAVHMLIKDAWESQDRDRQRVVSESMGGKTVTFYNGPIPLEVAPILQAYRRMRFS